MNESLFAQFVWFFKKVYCKEAALRVYKCEEVFMSVFEVGVDRTAYIRALGVAYCVVLGVKVCGGPLVSFEFLQGMHVLAGSVLVSALGRMGRIFSLAIVCIARGGYG